MTQRLSKDAIASAVNSGTLDALNILKSPASREFFSALGRQNGGQPLVELLERTLRRGEATFTLNEALLLEQLTAKHGERKNTLEQAGIVGTGAVSLVGTIWPAGIVPNSILALRAGSEAFKAGKQELSDALDSSLVELATLIDGLVHEPGTTAPARISLPVQNRQEVLIAALDTLEKLPRQSMGRHFLSTLLTTDGGQPFIDFLQRAKDEGQLLFSAEDIRNIKGLVLEHTEYHGNWRKPLIQASTGVALASIPFPPAMIPINIVSSLVNTAAGIDNANSQYHRAKKDVGEQFAASLKDLAGFIDGLGKQFDLVVASPADQQVVAQVKAESSQTAQMNILEQALQHARHAMESLGDRISGK